LRRGRRQNGRVAAKKKDGDPDELVARPTMPWWAAALGGAVVSAVAGWAMVAAPVLIAQLAQTGAVSGSSFRLATQAWLLGHGGVATIGTESLTLVPLGLTALIGLVIHGVALYAGKQAALSPAAGGRRGYTAMKVVGVLTGAYAVIVTALALVIDPGPGNLRAGLGALALSAVTGFFGARKSVGWDVQASWPAWARAVPKAMGAGALIALIGGAAALTATLVAHREQVVGLTTRLNPGWAGGVILTLVQLFFVVNIIVWCTTWTFGPGFTLGDGSVVSLVGSQVGLMPAFPISAGLPSGLTPAWQLIWLAFPVAAGAGAALVVLRERPRARFDETALVGGLAGVLSGGLVTGLAALTGGDLGMDRLSGIGPFLLPLLVVAPSIMGIGGLATGLVAGLIRRPAGASDERWWSRWAGAGDSDRKTDEPTIANATDRARDPGKTDDSPPAANKPQADTLPLAPGEAPQADEQPQLDFHGDEA